jgi:glucan phosphoethanolaminetransferase (alkaline phosphatase superfamily)
MITLLVIKTANSAMNKAIPKSASAADWFIQSSAVSIMEKGIIFFTSVTNAAKITKRCEMNALILIIFVVLFFVVMILWRKERKENKEAYDEVYKLYVDLKEKCEKTK